MKGITKQFPGVTALNHVDLSVTQGEMHALIGQNGAGKSTLMKILAGVYTADEGVISIAGRRVVLDHPHESMRHGIGTVYQELSLAPNLSVADNIFLGREPSTRLLIDQTRILKKAEEILERLGLKNIDVRTRTSELPLMQRQLVEIAKVLSFDPQILVLDEPTASLAEEETREPLPHPPWSQAKRDLHHLHLSPFQGDHQELRSRHNPAQRGPDKDDGPYWCNRRRTGRNHDRPADRLLLSSENGRSGGRPAKSSWTSRTCPSAERCGGSISRFVAGKSWD